MEAREVDLARTEMFDVLAPHIGRDWKLLAGSSEWSCWKTAAHVAHDLAAYAGQVASGAPSAYLPFDLLIREDASPGTVLDVAMASGKILGSVIAAAEPGARAWHYGPTDPSGFAAMGVGEMILHTWDIAQGLKIPWTLPEHLCTAVLQRLMPDAPAGHPAEVLLWSTGRGELAGYEPVTSWVWRAAVAK